MTSKLDISTGDRRRQRRFHLELGTAALAYVVVLAVAMTAASNLPEGPARWAIALLPVIPVTLMAAVTFRHLRRLDERDRARMLEGLGIGFVVAMLAAVSLGLLDVVHAGVPLAPWWIFCAGMAAWLVASAVQRAR